jgi:hypothetical protein
VYTGIRSIQDWMLWNFSSPTLVFVGSELRAVHPDLVSDHFFRIGYCKSKIRS